MTEESTTSRTVRLIKEEAREEERSAIVAWLAAQTVEDDTGYGQHLGNTYIALEELIERILAGEHLKKEERLPCRMIDLGVNWCTCHGPCL